MGQRLKSIPLPLPGPRGAQPSASIQAQLDAIDAKVNRLLEAISAGNERDDAFARFQTTGPTALPMNAHHVGIVLGGCNSLVYQMVHKGYLVRRWQNVAGFHPDDVRAAMDAFAKAKAEGRAE